jgi:hypothetical protein
VKTNTERNMGSKQWEELGEQTEGVESGRKQRENQRKETEGEIGKHKRKKQL